MNISISNIAWSKEDDDTMYTYLQTEGIQGLEIAPTRIVSENPYERIGESQRKLKEIQDKYGLRITSMQSIWFGKTENLFESSKSREILLDYTKQAIVYAREIRCPNLVFGCPRNRNMPVGASKEELLPFFREIGEYALEHGTIVALEPNPTIYNTNFLNTTKETIDYVQQIDSKGIQLNVDWGTYSYNEEAIETIEKHMDLVNHIHISEPYLEQITKRESHLELKGMLERTKYTKFISIEMKNLENIELVKETITYVKEVFQ